MARSLLLTVHFAEGRYHGTGDWPPAPGRVFQSLVAGAAEGGTIRPGLLQALAWLEQLPPPVIVAPPATSQEGIVPFVPNNDMDAVIPSGGSVDLDAALSLIKVPKPVKYRIFDNQVPIRYCWGIEDGSENTSYAQEVCDAARDIYQLGRGFDQAWGIGAVISAKDRDSLLDQHGLTIYKPSERGRAGTSLLCPRPGSLNSIRNRHRQSMSRLSRERLNQRDVAVFTPPPKPDLASVKYNTPDERLLFEMVGGEGHGYAPVPLDRAAPFVEDLRDRIAASIRENSPGLADTVERFLIGRGVQKDDASSRVRIVPLPSIGHRDTDMMIRRVAVYVPRSCPIPGEELAWALSQVAWLRADGTIRAELHPAGSRRMVERYEARSRYWRSVTPIAVPERPREKRGAVSGSDVRRDEQHATQAIRKALGYAGITGRPLSVTVRRTPSDREGLHSRSFAHGTRFLEPRLWHAEIEFAEPLSGPVVIGDGRFLGLGLMRPEEQTSGITALQIVSDIDRDADAVAITQAARRAMMARAQDAIGRRAYLPPYVSGHPVHSSGPVRSRSRDGQHRHVFITTDLQRQRILWIAPGVRNRDGDFPDEIAQGHKLVEQAVSRMQEIVAGSQGVFLVEPVAIRTDSDPLFALSRVWETITPYRVTKYSVGDRPVPSLIEGDVLKELNRQRLPTPERIDILGTSVVTGDRGGIDAWIRLTFRTVQPGPVLLGRTGHQGGGLFEGRGGIESDTA